MVCKTTFNFYFVRLGNKVFRQLVGILMRTNWAPLVVDLFFLFCYEFQFVAKLKKYSNKNPLLNLFNNTCGYLDDILILIFLSRSEFVQFFCYHLLILYCRYRSVYNCAIWWLMFPWIQLHMGVMYICCYASFWKINMSPNIIENILLNLMEKASNKQFSKRNFDKNYGNKCIDVIWYLPCAKNIFWLLEDNHHPT